MLSDPTAPTKSVKHDASMTPTQMFAPKMSKQFSNEDSKPSNGVSRTTSHDKGISKIPMFQTNELLNKVTPSAKIGEGAIDSPRPRAAAANWN